jgi:hypothetical protein
MGVGIHVRLASAATQAIQARLGFPAALYHWGPRANIVIGFPVIPNRSLHQYFIKN